ncbi:hypothetical protein KG166_004362 [Salmonella enterica subsp. enterica serovar Eastbourne]|nr:hypothetical protein [Salmonella enterica subsp. enterica serovar Eastbourne]
MTVKLTQTRLDNLIDTLNALICDDDLLNHEQKENMVRTVATLGGLEERIRQMTETREAKKIAKAEKAEKKPREPDLVFPRTGKIWTADDLELIHSITDELPDSEIDNHILWLSDRQGRTPYAIALKIVSEGRLDEEWAKKWKPVAKELREKYNTQHAETQNENS